MRRLPTLILLPVLALLLAGCRLSIDVDLEVDGGGGGTLALSVEADGDLSGRAAAAGVDPLGRLVERVEALDGPWEASRATDEATGTDVATVRADFADPAELAARHAELQGALDAPEARLLGPLSLAVDEEADVLSVDGVLPLELTEVAAADAGMPLEQLRAELADVVTSRLTVRTPGRVREAPGAVVTVDGEPAPADHDGPAVLTWTAAPGEVVQVATTFEPGGAPWVRVALGGAVVLLAVGLVVGGVRAQRAASGTRARPSSGQES